MAVTIKDVAKLAGVTPGTVSRALNGYTDINEDTKKRILDAVEELHYTPNAIAKSLSSRVSKNIGIILTNFLQTNSKDIGTFQMLQGIYLYASKHGYDVSIYMSEENSHTKLSYESFCSQHNISGAILSGITTKDPYLNELVTGGIPCVLIDVPLIGEGLGCVTIDNVTASKEITNVLFDHGHKDIMILAGKVDAAVNTERLTGIRQAFAEQGLTLSDERIAYCNFSETEAHRFTEAYLKKYGTGKATAFLCLSDLMAFGCMQAMKEAGYRIPEDFSVTGFDDHPLAEYMSPELTTVSQDFKTEGYESARLLTKLIKNPKQNLKVNSKYQVQIRGSVGVSAR